MWEQLKKAPTWVKVLLPIATVVIVIALATGSENDSDTKNGQPADEPATVDESRGGEKGRRQGRPR